jgi:hypothetical protein
MHKAFLMKKPFLLFLLLLSMARGVAQDDSVSKAQEIIRLEQQLADALPGDSATWRPCLDPSWYVTTEDGTGFTKGAYLATFAPFGKGFSGNIKVTKPVLVFHDNFAVIHYVADEHETVFGQQLHTTYGMVDTWYKKDTGWVMLSMLCFEIPQLPPAIQVGRAILEQYVGTYRLSEKRTAVVSLRHDTLFIRKGKNAPEALFPETSNVFFRMSDTRGRKFFVKGEDGQMVMRERRNGQDLVWKRESYK